MHCACVACCHISTCVHLHAGTVLIEVHEFRAVNASSPEVAPAMFKPPPKDDPDVCLTSNSVPALSSPFMASGAVVTDTLGSPRELIGGTLDKR